MDTTTKHRVAFAPNAAIGQWNAGEATDQNVCDGEGCGRRIDRGETVVCLISAEATIRTTLCIDCARDSVHRTSSPPADADE